MRASRGGAEKEGERIPSRLPEPSVGLGTGLNARLDPTTGDGNLSQYQESDA